MSGRAVDVYTAAFIATADMLGQAADPDELLRHMKRDASQGILDEIYAALNVGETFTITPDTWKSYPVRFVDTTALQYTLRVKVERDA